MFNCLLERLNQHLNEVDGTSKESAKRINNHEVRIVVLKKVAGIQKVCIMKINWKVRIRRKQFWVSLIALLIVLANQIAGIFYVDIKIYNDQVTAISENIPSILGLLGIIIDPTTIGVSDSTEAMDYNKLKDGEQ
ncbi:phage holin [Lysinibacillus sp. NPDC095746]|uniref:phage holin n=1 Tax=Lysinibacillus sp. NPDC095746 TaxID=3364134 RepID=UPI00382A222F